MKTLIKLVLIIAAVNIFYSCGNKLSEERAVKAANEIIKLHNETVVRGGRQVALSEYSLINISKTQVELRGFLMNSRDDRKAKGKFKFFKTADGDWICDWYYFEGGFYFEDTNVSYIVPK